MKLLSRQLSWTRAQYLLGILVWGVCCASSSGEDAAPDAVDVQSIHEAVEKALPLLAKAAQGSAKARQCFTCHNQALPAVALATAKSRGYEIDDDELARQVQHTYAHLERGRKGYEEGKGQGGRVLTAGYALWTLEMGGRADDDLTRAVAGYMLVYQKSKKHWSQSSNRPPSSGSDFAATYFALRGLEVFGGDERKEQIEARLKQVSAWLADAQPKDTEDRVFRLRSLRYANAPDALRQAAIADLQQQQRDDGGWAQIESRESDAYATATALSAIVEADPKAARQPDFQKGLAYLLKTQKADGSWQVETRAKAFQTYFESGFPHGKSQFISCAATGWAVLALLEAEHAIQ